jgi:two-component system OmpR family response regulator
MSEHAYSAPCCVALRPQERAVLQVLLAHADEIVSKEEIIESAARYGRRLTRSTIESYVSRLRKKLEPHIRILNVYGVGYLLVR